MPKKFLSSLVLIMLTSCIINQHPSSPAVSSLTASASPTSALSVPSPPTTSEESTIYKTVIESIYLTDETELIVLKDSTESGFSFNDSLNSTIEYVQENVGSEIQPDTVNDFKIKNTETYELETDIPLDIEYVLVNEKEINKILDVDDGWEHFQSSYPNSPGIITLSRVGFNNVSNQALVYTGVQGEYGTGQGLYVFLIKEGGDWIIQNMVVVWVS